MSATSKELNESIELLKNYRDRLREELINMSQKLRISQSKTEVTLKNNIELQNIDNLIKELISQTNKQSDENHL